jgi:hypothetical protein
MSGARTPSNTVTRQATRVDAMVGLCRAPGKEYPLSDAPAKPIPPSLITAGMVLVHASACAPLLYALQHFLPASVRQMYRDFNLALPAITQWVSAAGAWVGGYGSLLILAGLLAADAYFLWFLNHESPTLAWVCFLVVLILLLLLAGCTWWAGELAVQKLRIGLSR